MSFYKLPPPWNPGYAIPKQVMAEPPERGVFVTQWAPRGTIPQLIPDYLAVPAPQVKTKSSLSGSSLGGGCFDEHTLSGTSLGDDTLAAIGGGRTTFSKYGQKVAKDLMARMRGLPADQRGKVLKQTLAKLDKTLPARAEKYALEEKKRGASDQVALERGIARGVSEGVVTELATIGRSARALPQAGSPRGLGRSPQQGLGAISDTVRLMTSPVTLATQVLQAAQPQPGQCSADGQFIWSTSGGVGHWERLRAGQTCTSTFGGGGPVVNDQRGTTDPPLQAPPTTTGGGDFRAVQVGPFKFPADQDWSGATWWGNALPADWQAFIKRVITKDANQKVGSAGMFFGMSPDTMINNQYIGATTRTSRPDWDPVAKTKHPDNGKDYGVFLAISYRYPDKPMNDPSNAPILNVLWAPIQKAWYEKIWDWIENIFSKIVDVVGDAVDAVKDATCQLLQQPGIEQSAVAAAASAPSPATAGAAAGVVIGQKLCGPGQQQLPTSPTSNGMGLLVPLAVGGGILLLYALTR